MYREPAEFERIFINRWNILCAANKANIKLLAYDTKTYEHIAIENNLSANFVCAENINCYCLYAYMPIHMLYVRVSKNIEQ